MYKAKVTTLKAQHEGTVNGVGDSFRILYYGSASAGSVPFMWESQPGTPKHALTESSLPPLTPPPSYHQLTQKYNSSMQVINHNPTKRLGFFRISFLDSSRKKSTVPIPASSLSSSSVSSSSSSSRSLTPMGKTEARRAMKFGWKDDGGSPRSTLCFGGEFKKSYRIKKMKKAMV